MKKVILALFLALQMSMVSAQEMTVTYKMTYNASSPDLFAEAGLPEPMRSGLAAAYKDVVMYYQLIVKGNESEYRIMPVEGKQEITFMGQTMDVNAAAAAQAQNYTYKNHSEGVTLDKTQLFNKSVIVVDSIKSANNFTVVEGEKKEILGFECQKAVSADGKTTVWFSQQIPVKDEPLASGLDGLILQYDNGQQIFTASEISDSASKDIVRPTGSDIMTRDEFMSQMQKMMERMKRN